MFSANLNLGGLSALANKATPELHLPLWGVDVGSYYKNIYEGKKDAAQNQVQLAAQANQANIAKMQEDAANSRAVYGAQNQQAMKAAELQNQKDIADQQSLDRQADNKTRQDYYQGMLGFRNQEVQNQQAQTGLQAQRLQGQQDIDQQKLKLDQAQLALKQSAQLGEDHRNLLGSMASGYILGIQHLPDDQKDAFTKDFLTQQIQNGTLTSKQADQIMSMPQQQREAYAMSNLALLDKGSQLKTILDAQSKGGGVDANGNQISPNSPQTTALSQKQVLEANQLLSGMYNNLNQIQQNPSMLTGGGKLDLLAENFADKHGNDSIIGPAIKAGAQILTGKDENFQKDDIAKSTNFFNQMDQNLIQLAKINGIKLSSRNFDLVRKAYANGDMGPTAAAAAMKGTIENIARANNINLQNLNQGGVSTSAPTPQSLGVANPATSGGAQSGGRDKYGFTDADYAARASQDGKTVDQVKQAVAMGAFKGQ